MMENFLKSLTNRELRSWINHFTSYALLNSFINNGPSIEDLKLAKKILKNRG